jgi:hypothetical protein
MLTKIAGPADMRWLDRSALATVDCLELAHSVQTFFPLDRCREFEKPATVRTLADEARAIIAKADQRGFVAKVGHSFQPSC